MTDRYNNGKIYRLVNSVDNEFYVGSTCLTLCKRLYRHKTDAKRRPNVKIYSHLNTIGFENVKIVLIEEYPCNSKMELERKERYWIEQLKPTLNQKIPTRTQKEYRDANPEKIRESNANYQAKNREKLRKYREDNAERIREIKAKYETEKSIAFGKSDAVTV